jgi:hypothetical protein
LRQGIRQTKGVKKVGEGAEKGAKAVKDTGKGLEKTVKALEGN